jgi:hypothetical protein
MTLVLCAISYWAYANYGAAGLNAAAVAWIFCTVPALVALVISAMFAATPLAPTANLGTMGIRMGVPLIGLIALPNVAPTLAEAGLLPCLLTCYLVALVVETLLVLRHVVPTTKVSPNVSASALEAK